MAAILDLCKLGVNQVSSNNFTVTAVFRTLENIGIDTKISLLQVLYLKIWSKLYHNGGHF